MRIPLPMNSPDAHSFTHHASSANDFRNFEVASFCIGRVGGGDLLAETGAHNIVAAGVYGVAVGSRAMRHRRHVGGIEFVEMVDVTENGAQLASERIGLGLGEFEPRQFGDFFNVITSDRHTVSNISQ